MAENDRILPPLEMTRIHAIKAQSNAVNEEEQRESQRVSKETNIGGVRKLHAYALLLNI
jgi:hypothetical protein